MRVDRDEGLFNKLADEIRATNERLGWYETDRTFGDDIALIHSELSEALDAFRTHGTDDFTALRLSDDAPPSKPEGVGSEFADVLIRLLDAARRHDVDLWVETRRKMDFNKTRGYRHGGKRL